MSEGFDYGGEVAETSGGYKNPDVGSRNARLYGLLRLGTFREKFKKTIKDPAPEAVAIFHLLGKNDKMDDDSPMFFTKPFPLKKGDKSFLHGTFIPAFGGMAKHKGFHTMINGLFSLKLKGGKEKNDDDTPKYINFDTMSEISEDMLELANDSPKYAALENPVGFLTEDQLTEEALKLLHPTREFYGILMQTEEYQAGTHPCQELITKIFEEDKERYTPKEKESTKGGGDDENKPTESNSAQSMPKEQVDDEEQEF